MISFRIALLAGIASGVYTIKKSNKLKSSLVTSTVKSSLLIGGVTAGSALFAGIGGYHLACYTEQELTRDRKGNYKVAGVFLGLYCITFGGLVLAGHCGTIGIYAGFRSLHRHFNNIK